MSERQAKRIRRLLRLTVLKDRTDEAYRGVKKQLRGKSRVYAQNYLETYQMLLVASAKAIAK